MLADAAVFPRDKTCGDGLTPRAIGELQRLGLEDWLRAHTVNQGLRAHGFGQTLLLPWPGGTLPDWGSAVARTELDDHLRTTAIKAGATAVDGARAVDVRRDGDRVAAVVFRTDDGDRRDRVPRAWSSPTASARRWARCSAASGTATPSTASPGARYVASEMSDDPWISSHLELRGQDGEILSGYGWIFPLGTGEVNIGVGTLATAKRPANIAIKPLMALLRRAAPRGVRARPASCGCRPRRCCRWAARCRNVAGPNWALIGDAAACVNPLNGEGIDYGLETGRLVAEMMAERPRPRPRSGRRCCASTTARRSRSPAGWPGW